MINIYIQYDQNVFCGIEIHNSDPLMTSASYCCLPTVNGLDLRPDERPAASHLSQSKDGHGVLCIAPSTVLPGRLGDWWRHHQDVTGRGWQSDSCPWRVWWKQPLWFFWIGHKKSTHETCSLNCKTGVKHLCSVKCWWFMLSRFLNTSPHHRLVGWSF